jgi:hypothetical protein
MKKVAVMSIRQQLIAPLTYLYEILGLGIKILEFGRELFDINERIGGHGC